MTFHCDRDQDIKIIAVKIDQREFGSPNICTIEFFYFILLFFTVEPKPNQKSILLERVYYIIYKEGRNW